MPELEIAKKEMVRQNVRALAHLLCHFSNLVGHSKLGFKACCNFNEVFHQIFCH